VPDAAVRTALNDARRNAAGQVLAGLESIPTSGSKRLGRVLADPKVRGDLEGWLMSLPVTSAEFRDNLEVRVSVAPDPDALWTELTTAASSQKDLDFPRNPDELDPLHIRVIAQISPTVGRALAKAPGAAAVAPQNTANTGVAMPVEIPHDPPRWITDQIDAKASSKRVDGALKTARAAENAARDKLRTHIEELSLSPKLTLGDAAKRDERVRAAIDRAVRNARPRKVNYLADGGAEVTFSFDLRELWYELDAR
jgi:hypothetical protein